MAFITVDGSLEPIASAIDRIIAIGINPTPVLAAIGPHMVANTQQRMREGIDPDGVRWEDYAPLNPLYAIDKHGPSILIGQGGFARGLAGTLTSQADGSSLIWGSNKEYAAVHQFGALIQPKSALQLSFVMGGELIHASSVYVPARPYLGFTEEDRQDVIEELDDFLTRAMGGR